MMSRHMHHMTDEDHDAKLRMCFDHFDKNGDGFITSSELREVMKNLGEELTDDEVGAMIREADSDGDGQITYQGEMLLLLNGGGERQRRRRRRGAGDDNKRRH